MKIKKNSNGFMLIELLVAISFMAVIVVLISGLGNFTYKLRKLHLEKTQALLLAREGAEVVRLLNWNVLNAGNYHPLVVGNTWSLADGSELIDSKYSRLITIGDVHRASTTNGQVYGPIVESGGYLDPDSKKVGVTINWNSHGNTNQQETLDTYVYRWGASRWTQTDWVGGANQANWTDSTRFANKDAGVDTDITGTVSLNAGLIDWTNATTTAHFDTPGNFDDNDVYEANGFAYLVTENNPSGSEFYVLDVSNMGTPIQVSSLDIGDGVTSVVLRGNYAYLSTRGDNQELVVVNVADKNNPFIADTYNLPSNRDAQDLVVDQTELYVVQYDILYSFSINNPASTIFLDSLSVDDNAWELFVSENNVYIATQDSDKEFQVVGINNPANLQLVGQYDLPGSLKGTDVNVRGTRAYISTENNGGGNEFYVLDISNPSNPTLLGSYEVGEKVHSFTLVGPYALLGTNLLQQELVVVDIVDPGNITKVSGFDLDGYVLGMSANCSVIYAATSSNQGEFFIIWTQVYNCEYASGGTLESSTLDTGSDNVAYNWISWTGTAPQGTSIRFQLATSNDQAGPWNYAGPDGTGSAYYTDGSAEDINYNHHLNQRYVRYKLFLDSTTDFTVPILEEVTISYSAN